MRIDSYYLYSGPVGSLRGVSLGAPRTLAVYAALVVRGEQLHASVGVRTQ